MNIESKVNKIIDSLDSEKIKCSHCLQYIEKENIQYVMDINGNDNVPVCRSCIKNDDTTEDAPIEVEGVELINSCKECNGKLEILGTGILGDTIEVECSDCGEGYEVEPDFFSSDCLEMAEAILRESERK